MVRNWCGLNEIVSPQILRHPNIPGNLKGTAFSILRKLCGTFGKLPTSCLIEEDFKTREEIPFATRGFTDLWKREWNGKKVAVKMLRLAPDDDRSKTIKVMLLWSTDSPESHEELTFARRGSVKKCYCGNA